MIDPSDYELNKTPPPTPVVLARRSPAPWLLTLGALVVGGAVIWFWQSGNDDPQPDPAPAVDAAASALMVPAHGTGAICPAVEALPLPRLDESDGFAGALATTLSQHPRVVGWLATEDLIRRFVVVVDLIASGKSPAAHLGSLRPTGVFRTAERGDALFLDPRNGERYQGVTDAVDSIDVEAAARVCSALKPRLDDAYEELGRGGTFDAALERALVSLLQAPSLGPDVRLAPQGTAYAFEDQALESLAPAQKQLARMGTRHVRVIQDKLRQIALAIGIPRERLPR